MIKDVDMDGTANGSGKGTESSRALSAVDAIEEILSALSDSSGLERETCSQIFSFFLLQSDELIDNLKELLQTFRYDEAKALLHKLKGSAGNVRATSIMEMAIKGEEAIESQDYDGAWAIVAEVADLLTSYQSISPQ